MSFYKEGPKVPKEVIVKEKDSVFQRQVNVHEGKGVFELWMETYNNTMLIKIYQDYIRDWAMQNWIRFGGKENILQTSKFHVYVLDRFHFKTTKVMIVMQINRYDEYIIN